MIQLWNLATELLPQKSVDMPGIYASLDGLWCNLVHITQTGLFGI